MTRLSDVVAEKRKLEFFLLRYVPSAVRETFVDIGLVMIEESKQGSMFADVRFTRDWDTLLCLDPQADIEMLQALEGEIRRRVADVRNCESVMQSLNDSFSNLIQLSGAKGCLTEDPQQEIETMARLYFERERPAVKRVVTGRQKILGIMHEEWGRAGITKFLNPVPVAKYTKAGDPFKFDFGYRLEGRSELKLFHAVSLRANVNAAVTLGARYAKIAEAMRHSEERLEPVLTAVIDDGLEQVQLEVGFALGMMQENGIRVRPVSEMARIAEEARVELRA
jgi:hypothetical protein